MINLRHVEVFHAIMRTGSVTGAARLLNVTQPAVSATLKHFESRLKMKLFERAHGRLFPTAEAEALTADVAEIFSRLEAVDRLSQDLANGVRGHLSIAAASPIAHGYLAYAVASFMAERTGLKIVLQALSSQVLLERVLNREVDLGLAFEPVLSPALEVQVLTHSYIACVLPASHPLADHPVIHVQDLVPYPVLTYLPQALMRMHIDRLLNETGVTLNIVAEFGISISGIMLAFHGAGIALVQPDLLSVMSLPGLVMRPLYPKVEFEALILRHRSMPRSRIVEDFIEHLRSCVSEQLLDKP